MSVWLDDSDIILRHGDAAAELAALEPATINCIVTSPPYYGLRDYGTGRWVGGSEQCDHLAPPRGGQGEASAKQVTSKGNQAYQYPRVCGKCGAQREDEQLGQEESPAAFVEALCRVFDAARIPLRRDGCLWVNLGDSYAQGHGGSSTEGGGATMRKAVKQENTPRERVDVDVSSWSTRDVSLRHVVPGLKPKDMIGVPWRFALAMQDRGWWLRRDVIWAKPNPMPESCEDRPTTAHEYVFLFTQQPRYAYYKEHFLEPATPDGRKQTTIASNGAGVTTHENYANRQGGERWPGGDSRNARSVWVIPTQPYHGAHFATFPEELARRCILLGSKPGDTVCDPFVGSGTTCLVARNHERRSVGIDLDEHALTLAADRTKQRSLLIG
jgi:DNA modification methylase